MTTVQKTRVEPTWDAAKVRESAALVAVTNLTTALSEIGKYGPEAEKAYQEAWTNNAKIAYARRHNVKTPLELVSLTAEFEANTFGSVIEFWGDHSSASYTYERCGCFEAAQAYGTTSCENAEKFQKFFAASGETLARAFGFTFSVVEGKEGFPTLTFKK